MCDFEEQIKKIIEILTITLHCSGSGGNGAELAEKLQSVMQNLNLTALLDSGNGDGVTTARPMRPRPVFRTFLNAMSLNTTSDPNSVSTSVMDAFNGTGAAVASGTSPMDSFMSTTTTAATPTPMPPGLKLHRLEIIKVVVLIIVISIILLTTCRMVFQLFLRFRPEKNP